LLTGKKVLAKGGLHILVTAARIKQPTDDMNPSIYTFHLSPFSLSLFILLRSS
jgi:hypothetical protein